MSEGMITPNAPRCPECYGEGFTRCPGTNSMITCHCQIEEAKPAPYEPTEAEVEAAARALCADQGGNWHAASFAETSNGCEPEQERASYRHLATIALKAAHEAREKSNG